MPLFRWKNGPFDFRKNMAFPYEKNGGKHLAPASRPGILIAISGEGDDQPLDATGCGARAEKSWL